MAEKKKAMTINKKKALSQEQKGKQFGPLVSVNMPTGPVKVEYFKQAVESIMGQSFTAWELVIVLNGAPPEVEEAAHAYFLTVPGIVIDRLDKGDIINSRNRAVEISRGKYIALLDSDDLSDPTRLQKQFDYLEAHPEIGFCGTSIHIIAPGGDIQTNNTTMGFDGVFADFEALKSRTKANNIFVNSSVMCRTELMKAAPYKRQWERGGEDYEVWMDIIWNQGKQAGHIYEPLVSWRNNPHSFTHGRMSDLKNGALNIINAYRHHWDPPVVVAEAVVNETINLEDLNTKYAAEVAILRKTQAMCDKHGVQYNIDGKDNKLQELPRFFEYAKGMFLSKGAGYRVLDSGSGYSLFPLALAVDGKEVYSLDDGYLDMRIMQAEALDLKIYNKTGRFQKLPYEDNFFDMAYCISCLEHLESLQDLYISLQELRRVVRPGGLVYITTDYYKEYIDYGKATWGHAAPQTRYFSGDTIHEHIVKPSGMTLIGNQEIVDNTHWDAAPLYGSYTFCSLLLRKE